MEIPLELEPAYFLHTPGTTALSAPGGWTWVETASVLMVTVASDLGPSCHFASLDNLKFSI